jgi:DNA-binding YbaB/EbfC family protein
LPSIEEEQTVRPGGQPNLQQMMKQAQKMQQQMVAAQAELAETELTGTAGGGLVTAVVRGSGEVVSVKIDPKVVDPEDVETLEDLVVAALHNAAQAAKDLTEEKMGPLTAGLGGLGGGLGLPGF